MASEHDYTQLSGDRRIRQGESSRLAEAPAFLAKARQNLAAAEADFAAGRHDVCANRAYYSCFQSAVAALLVEGMRPAGRAGQWGHAFVQAQFVGVLIGRRKRYTADLRTTLLDHRNLRDRADYTSQPVPPHDAGRALWQARAFVAVVEEQMPWQQRSSV